MDGLSMADEKESHPGPASMTLMSFQHATIERAVEGRRTSINIRQPGGGFCWKLGYVRPGRKTEQKGTKNPRWLAAKSTKE